MKNTVRKLGVAVALIATAAACNPYQTPNKGPLKVVRVEAINRAIDNTIPPQEAAFDAGTGTYVLTNLDPARNQVIAVTFNKALDPASVETPSRAGQCIPSTPWFAMTGAPTPFACYVPQVIGQEGSMAWLFNAALAYTSTSTTKFNSAALTPGADTTIVAAVGVRDNEGGAAAFRVFANVAPFTAVPTFTFTGPAATSVAVNWTEPAGVSPATATVGILRADDAGGVPGTFAVLPAPLDFIPGTTAGVAETRTDATSGTQVRWYRIRSRGANNTQLDGAFDTPARPRNVVVTPGTGNVVITWDVGLQVTNYTILRAVDLGYSGPGVSDTPGAYTAITATATGGTFTDSTVNATDVYWYIVQSNVPGGTIDDDTGGTPTL